ncbi:hypothetical protein [Streptomyces sp. NBC_01707]|uniref:hypothetical protein n=1 Tax=Streptomyces sp. NBC_01707 TaxID=2975914 RepID=UPI00352FC7FB
MSPNYLAYLEDNPADPNVATVIRLADALGITVAALRGGGVDLAPVPGPRAAASSAAGPSSPQPRPVSGLPRHSVRRGNGRACLEWRAGRVWATGRV